MVFGMMERCPQKAKLQRTGEAHPVVTGRPSLET